MLYAEKDMTIVVMANDKMDSALANNLFLIMSKLFPDATNVNFEQRSFTLRKLADIERLYNEHWVGIHAVVGRLPEPDGRRFTTFFGVFLGSSYQDACNQANKFANKVVSRRWREGELSAPPTPLTNFQVLKKIINKVVGILVDDYCFIYMGDDRQVITENGFSINYQDKNSDVIQHVELTVDEINNGFFKNGVFTAADSSENPTTLRFLQDVVMQ